MRTPEEWVRVYVNSPRYTVAMLVKEVQKEAYNEALDDAVNNVKQDWDPVHGSKIDKESILKLKL